MWQTFVHLLEQVDASKYKMMMAQLNDIHKEHVHKMQDKFDEEVRTGDSERTRPS